MRAVAIICFFFSGASGLVFEIIWSRMFSLVFGATTLAISTVLTAFMGGLALGSFLAGRYADRLQDPLKAYALAEAGVGVTALLVPVVVNTFGGLNQLLYQHVGDNYVLLSAARFLSSAAVMVVPTTLMGATLPLLSRLFIQTRSEHSRIGLRVGTLYAINTFGAVVGTSLGGFALLPNLGLTMTNRLAAGTNLALALVVGLAYLIRQRLPAPHPQDEESQALLEQLSAAPVAPLDVSPRARRAALAAFGFSGAVAMIYQVMWSRALAMNIGSSVYSFTLVLVAFLIGLAAGAATLGRLASRAKNPLGWLAVNHLVIVVLVGLSYLLMDKLPFIFLFLVRGEQLEAATVLRSQFAMALLIMLPATFAMGGIFPLTIRASAAGLEHVGRDVGSAYSINTIGAIAGSFLGGFLVLPVLQLQMGHLVAMGINLALALVLIHLAGLARRTRLALTAVALALALAAPSLPRWNLNHLSSGLFRLSIARTVLESGTWKDPELVYYKDGICTTVTVEKWSKEHFSMKNNGKVDASTGDDMPTQIAVGLLPLLLHPRAPELRPEVALVGYASGVTAGAMLQYPVKRLDVIELEPAILEASRFFDHVNHKPRQDPRLRLITDDGRNFLQASAGKYDVIVNEPSNPWITGVANLFTKEYFETARRRLRPDGIFCSWAQMYEISPRHIKSIYKTFASVFPHVYAFSAEALSSDTFLIGANQPLKLDIRRLRRAFANPLIRAELARARINKPDDLIGLTLLGPGEVDAFTVGAAINTDDNALIEFGAPRDLYNHRHYDYFISKVYGLGWLYGRLADFITGHQGSEEHAALVYSLLINGKFREATYFASRVQPAAGPLSQRVSFILDLLGPRGVDEQEVPLVEGEALEMPRAPRRAKVESEQINKVARDYFVVEQRLKERRYRAALDLLESWPEPFREEAGQDFQLLWGFLVYKCFDFNAAVNILEPLWQDKAYVARRPALLYYLGRCFYGNADFGKAIKALEQWMDVREAAQQPVVPPPVEQTGEQDVPLLQVIPGG